MYFEYGCTFREAPGVLSLGVRKIGTRSMCNALPITACDSTNRKALGQITCRVGRRF